MLKKMMLLTPVLVGVFYLPVYPMERIDESALKKVYGRGGIIIEIDQLSIKSEIQEMRYTDDDGFFDGKPTSVFISNTKTYQRFTAIKDETNREGLLQAAYNDERILGEHAIKSYKDTKNLTIDVVSEAPLLTAISKYNRGGGTIVGIKPVHESFAVQGIAVTLPTLEIVADALKFSIGIRREGAINNNAVFFQCTGSGKNVMAILDGKIEIAAH